MLSYYQRHREKILEYQKLYNRLNASRIREYNKMYYFIKKNIITENTREYRQDFYKKYYQKKKDEKYLHISPLPKEEISFIINFN